MCGHDSLFDEWAYLKLVFPRYRIVPLEKIRGWVG